MSPAGMPTGAALPARHRIGSFEMLSVKHRSSAGLVYHAWDHALVRPVAIKEYLPSALALRDANLEVHALGQACATEFERGHAAFTEEARVLARCDHPSLVRVLSLFEAGGTVYRVMPWYAGHPLGEVRRMWAGPIGEPALRAFLDHLLGALEVYQRVGSVHLGVRPSQVLWLDDERPMLLGPGMAGRAAQTPSLEALGADASEAGFAPPEQADLSDGQPLGPWSDFYAMAALARFWITGVSPPPVGTDAFEPLAATVERVFGPSPSVRYSDSLLRALDAALAPDVASRPQTAAQFREALQDVPLPAPAAAASMHEVDLATADRIRRVIDSIDEPGDVALPTGLNDGPALRADPADRAGPHAVRRPPLAQRHPVLWAGGALAAVLAVGVWAMEFQGHPLRPSAAFGWLPVVLQQPEVQARAPTEPSAVIEAAPRDATPPGPTPQAAPAAAVLESTSTSTAPVAIAPASAAQAATARAALAAPVAQKAPVTQAMPDPAAPDGMPEATRARVAAADPSAKGELSARAVASSPRQECGARTEFALYRCMQQQCSLPRWRRHPQCVQLEETDTVD